MRYRRAETHKNNSAAREKICWGPQLADAAHVTLGLDLNRC